MIEIDGFEWLSHFCGFHHKARNKCILSKFISFLHDDYGLILPSTPSLHFIKKSVHKYTNLKTIKPITIMSKVFIKILLLLFATCNNVVTAVNVRRIKRGRKLVMKRQVLTAASPVVYSTKAPSPGKGKGSSSKSPSYSTKSPSKSTKIPKMSPKKKSTKKDSKKSAKGSTSSTSIQAAAQMNGSMAETMTVGLLSAVLATAILWM
jgi:hypothetical protein